MINIIIGEDNVLQAKKVEKIVTKFMHNLDYKIYLFYDYDIKFLEFIKKDIPNKIYLLDIETPSASGIDMARKIRTADYSSVIIFLSVHDDLSRIVAKKNIMALNFINKFDNLEENLTESLKNALNIVGRKRMVRLEAKGVIYNIDEDRILYVTKDTLKRETIIVCDNNSYNIKMNLRNIIEKLNNNFVQVHRSCFINKCRCQSIDIKNMCITFDNGSTTNIVSRKYLERMVLVGWKK